VGREVKTDDKTELVCSTCHKPVSLRARTDVTKFLSVESRCSCVSPTLPPGQPVSIIVEVHDALGADLAAGAEEVQKNLGERYEVVSLLGQGGMGAVYKVKDKVLEKTFAIKMLNPALVADSNSVKRFEQEAHAASNLTHANLVAVYEYGMGKKGSPFIVMDYLAGDTLAERISKSGYLSIPDGINISVQIAEALAHAHTKGVIHRDIKPSNIILCKTESGLDNVKIVDFGIAKVLPTQDAANKLTQTGDIFGSPQYMSPEQCLGNKLDARSDIYAFGCVMYEALTGVPALQAENPIKLIIKQINDMPVPPSQLKQDYAIPADLEYVVMRCLSKEPSDRYQSAQAVLTDLQSIRDGRKLKYKSAATLAKKDVEKKITPVELWCLIIAVAVGVFAIACVVGNSESGPYPTTGLAVPIPPGGLQQAVGGPKLVGDLHADADELDRWSYKYFMAGDYAKAIPYLEFGIRTYKEGGKHYGNNGGEDTYLADNYQHLGKCYLALNKPLQAVPNYQEALRLYNKYGKYPGGGMAEAVADYATALDRLGRSSEAAKMRSEFDKVGRLSVIP